MNNKSGLIFNLTYKPLVSTSDERCSKCKSISDEIIAITYYYEAMSPSKDFNFTIDSKMIKGYCAFCVVRYITDMYCPD